MKRVLAESGRTVEFRRRSNFLEVVSVGLLSSACLFAPCAIASVYTLTPGNTITATSSGFPSGGPVLSSITAPFASATIQGTVTSRVINDPANPYGGLTFEYLLTLSSGTDNASQLSVGGYAGLPTDVSFNTTSPGLAPSFFSRSTTGVNNGDTLEFSWLLNKLSPGQSGDWVVVQTSAHVFGADSGSVIDSTAAGVSILAPVPEPQIASLTAMGLGALFIFLRRNSK